MANTALYILLTVIVMGVIYFLIFKFLIQKNYVSKNAFEDLQVELAAMRIESSNRLSKEDVAANYVTREYFDSINESLREAKDELQHERKENLLHQGTILKLTTESEQKISKVDLEQNYVAKETYDIVSHKLIQAETVLEENGDTIIKLTAESEQKLSKIEVERNFIPKESFDIVKAKLDESEKLLTENTRTILALNKDLTTIVEQEKNTNEKLLNFNKELEALHTLSKEQFKNLATDILEEKKKLFVESNKTELNHILDPFKAGLTEFKDKVEATRKEDIQDITSLKKEIESLHKLNTQLSDDARNLATALKSEVKMQGSWGEDRLNMILEAEGLQRYIDFTREDMYRDEELEKNRKPDFILKLPNGKCIIIDSKVSLAAYVNYYNADTAEQKIEFLKQHLRSVTDHIDKLADKNYQTLAGLTTPDYVFMFMPVESALTLALNQNSDIFTNALKRKIVLITPTTLVATLKIVKILWQKENQVKNVEEIFRQCGELYNKFVSFLEEMDKIEAGLNSANKAHAEAMHHLKDGAKKGNTIIGRFETIKKLEAKTNKQIPAKYLAEIDLLDGEEDVKVLDTGIIEIATETGDDTNPL
jgi:DNA recombination protein RmuC